MTDLTARLLPKDAAGPFPPVVEGADRGGRVIFVCEHASCVLPASWGTLGLTPDQRRAHIAWDPGALGLARGLAARLDATLVHAPVSRLIYDCNRAPDLPGAMPARSEVHDIPGNAEITPAERLRRTNAVYLPFHQGLQALLATRLALGRAPVLITIHSFTPVYFGQPRTVEFGVIHDRDTTLAALILEEARAQTRLACDLNAPYSAADGVTHMLAVQATPHGIPNAMLELRNDLIATPEAEEAMAATLAPVLAAALARMPPAGGLP
jgi:predicted N-formylglutamate amidohydrolase